MERGEPTALGQPGSIPMLTDTPARADFWRYTCERQMVYERREAGSPPPWTTDDVIQRYHFTNVYRELDKGTAWFHDLRARRGLTSLEDVLWAAVTYRTINRLDVFDALDGPPSADEDSVNRWLTDLAEYRTSGHTIFTQRHQTRGLPGYHKTLEQFLPVLGKVAADIWVAPDPKSAFLAIKGGVFGLGPFFAHQIYLDLLEAGLLEHIPGVHRFTALGLGSTNALRWMYEGRGLDTLELNGGGQTYKVSTDAGRLELVRFLTDNAADAFEDLGLDFPYKIIESRDLGDVKWHSLHLMSELRVKDIEHTLCEYLRYGLARGGTRGRLTYADYSKAEKSTRVRTAK